MFASVACSGGRLSCGHTISIRLSSANGQAAQRARRHVRLREHGAGIGRVRPDVVQCAHAIDRGEESELVSRIVGRGHVHVVEIPHRERAAIGSDHAFLADSNLSSRIGVQCCPQPDRGIPIARRRLRQACVGAARFGDQIGGDVGKVGLADRDAAVWPDDLDLGPDCRRGRAARRRMQVVSRQAFVKVIVWRPPWAARPR